MIKKRLLNMVPESKRYIAFNVLFQWDLVDCQYCYDGSNHRTFGITVFGNQ